MTMTHSERGRLGAIRSYAAQKEKWLAVRKAYEESPPKCLACAKSIPYTKRRNKFCNRSCAASHNNFGRIKNLTGINGLEFEPLKDRHAVCVLCKKELTRKQKKYCSLRCSSGHQWSLTKEKIRAGKVSGPKTLRKFMLEEFPHRCTPCGRTTWTGDPIPLAVHHLDGDPSHNIPENLQLICPNCHAKTQSYKGRNKGKERDANVAI